MLKAAISAKGVTDDELANSKFTEIVQKYAMTKEDEVLVGVEDKSCLELLKLLEESLEEKHKVCQ